MKQKIICAAVITAACLLLVVRCLSPIAGNGSQTPNSKVASMLYNPGGSPAANAKVCFYRHDNDPRPGHDSGVVDSTRTDVNGNYSATLDTGTYTIAANGDSGLAFQDSIKAVGGDTVRPKPDTLKPAGTIRGVVQLEQGGDPRTVFILFMGTRTFTWPDDSMGNFSSDPMAGGRYRVRILTTLPDYEIIDTIFTVIAGTQSVMPDTIRLKYTGIPMPKGLSATYDTVHGIVTLRWNRVAFQDLQGYIVYRNDTATTLPERISGNSAVTDTFYYDTVFQDLFDINTFVYEYRVKVQDKSANIGDKFSAPCEVTAASPTKVRTFIALKTINTINDTASINDSVKIIASYQNQTRMNSRISWYVEKSDSLVNEKHIPLSAGSDTLMNIWRTPGVKKVFVKIRDTAGTVWEDSITVTIVLDVPVANAGNDTTVGRGDTIHLQGSKSTDRFGKVVKYEWDIGNTGNFIECRTGDTDIVAPDTFNFEGIKYVLRVTDDDGQTCIDTMEIHIGVWRLKNGSAGFTGRNGHTCLVYDNKMWIIGGELSLSTNHLPQNDVWYSTNGIDWTLATGSAAFPPRYDHCSVVFNNKMWVFAGEDGTGKHYNDAWSSSDGIQWTSSGSNYSERYCATAVVFDNKIWLIGGVNTNGALSDVWYSSDGTNWVQAIDSAGFNKRDKHASIVFNNRIWVIGGSAPPVGAQNDVWSSIDGINWIQATASAEFSRREYSSAQFFNNSLCIYGGSNSGSDFSDVWYSTDGITWKLWMNSGISGRLEPTTVIFNNKWWLFGGYVDMQGCKNDVWCLE